MTNAEALALDEDLQDLKRLRTNRFWVTHLVPEITQLRDEHRAAMRDLGKPQSERCEHVTAWERLQHVLDFGEREETRLRGLLKEFDAGSDVIERPFSQAPH